MPLIIPNSIENDTPADAAELQQNFSEIQTYVNTNLVNRDGSVALTQPLLLPGDPTLPNHAANKDYVDGSTVASAGDVMTGPLSFGWRTGQHLILHDSPTVDFGVGAQENALYLRSYVDIRTYFQGVHSDTHGDAGTGGSSGPVLSPTGVFLPMTQSTDATAATRKDYVDAQVNIAYSPAVAALPKSGGTMTGTLTLDTPQSTAANAAVSYTYVDANYVRDSGDTMSGTLLVGGDPFQGQVGAGATVSGALGSLRNDTGTNVQIFKASPGFGTGRHYIGCHGQTVASVLCTITSTSTSSADIFPASDYRLKDDLGEIENPLERLMQLQPKHLRWKSDGVEFDGFLAHEVQEVVPYAVVGEKDAVTDDGEIDPQMLSEPKLISLLVAAVQELTARVAELEAA